MSDEKALLAAIWEHPHEDTPRLVYADWLQENGQPERAEFIRVQCELAQLDEWDEDRRPALEKREKKLRKQSESAWRAGLPADLRKSPFHRGFVAPEERRTNATAFCALPRSAFAAAPLWDYYFEGPTGGLSDLARCTNLLRLGKLKFWTGTTPQEVSEIFGSPHLRNVSGLSLGYGVQWVSGLAALGASSAAENLSELRIHEGFTDDSAAALGSGPGFEKLRAFEAYRHSLTPKGLRAIFCSPHLANLTELTLPSWYGEEGARTIAETRPHFRLRKLEVYGNPMTDAGVALIANWPGLASVRSLNISGRCEVAGPRALADSAYATSLRELDLGLSNLSRAGAVALAGSKTLNLRRLLIRSTPAAEDETAVAALVERFGKDAVKVRYPGQRRQN